MFWLIHETENGIIKGSLTGINIGAVSETQKIWKTFQALGDIAFAYSYSMILIEIQVLIYFAIFLIFYYTCIVP
jgi:hypothetical protein